jgi:hypothetical protein
VHPIERLRYVARAEGAGPSVLVREAAAALAGFADDPRGMVTACRRLVERHPEAGPMWWLAARMLAAEDPAREARRVAGELERDATPAVLSAILPEDATVTLVGWPELAAAALRARGDIEALVVESAGEGSALAGVLGSCGLHAVAVPESGLASAVLESGLVLLEGSALGPGGSLGAAGSLAAASVARTAGTEVWTVSGEGRLLPRRVWDSLLGRLRARPEEPWERGWEVTPVTLLDAVVGPGGREEPSTLLAGPSWAAPSELLKPLG